MQENVFLRIFLSLAVIFAVVIPTSISCSTHDCQISKVGESQMLDACSSKENCAQGLLCGSCPANGNSQLSCLRGSATHPASIIKGLPFNKYTWITTHNAFSILGEPSNTGAPRVTFYNQEDSVTSQLRNGVRGLMLDMYDFDGDIWLCHSFQGQCFNFTAFGPAINTLKEVEEFLSSNPSEIVTIIIEDYVHTPKGLTKLFTYSGLVKFWFPVSEMPKNGKDWPTITEMVEKNHRLLVFTSNPSKEAEEGIAFQWRYFLENEPGDPGLVEGSCPNRKESRPMNSRMASLILMNYFPTIPIESDACKEHSDGLVEMVNTCFRAAGNLMPNFVAVNYYLRSDGGGVFDVVDRINGLSLCGCPTISACQDGLPPGNCKKIGSPKSSPMSTNGSFYAYFSPSESMAPNYPPASLMIFCLLIAVLGF